MQKLTLTINETRELVPLSGWYRSSASQAMRSLSDQWNLRFLIHNSSRPTPLSTYFETLQSPKMDILISSDLLKKPEEFAASISKLQYQFHRLQKLIDLGLILKDIIVSEKGLEFTILRVRHPIQDQSLRWIQKAIAKFKINVFFTFEENEPDLIDYTGFTIDKSIYLNSKDILPYNSTSFLNKEARATLAHELVHGFRSAMHERRTGLLFWVKTKNPDEVLSPLLPDAYQKIFRTDEFEAWRMSHHFTNNRKDIRDLFLMQIPWLKEAQELLESPDFAITGVTGNLQKIELELDLSESNVILRFELIDDFLDDSHLKAYLYNEISQRIRQLEKWTKAPSSLTLDEIPF